MESLFIYVVLLCCLPFIEGRTGKSFRSDYTYNPTVKAWFKMILVPANWYEARLRCSLEGAILASPTSDRKQSQMLTVINSTWKDESELPEIFTGIHATFAQGAYFTVEGTPLSKISHTWAKNEPDNKENKERCLTMNRAGELADLSCEETRPYMCYLAKESSGPVNECGTTDPEYRLDSRTNSCYKFHTVVRNFSRAFFTCHAEGGHLAIINSDTEATVLRELFAMHPGGHIVGNVWKHAAFIGFHDWGEKWDFRTIFGQKLAEAGYSKFSGGEPNNFTPGESCGAIYRSGLLDNLWCDRPAPFICEKDPDYPMVYEAIDPED